MTQDDFFITPEELCEGLAELGCSGVDERRLRNWWSKGLLPRPARHSRGAGGGSGSIRGWTDPDIVLWAVLAHLTMSAYARHEEAKLLLWFAGFEYPLVEMRDIWTNFENNRIQSAFTQSLGGPVAEGAMHESVDLVMVSLEAMVGRRRWTPWVAEMARAGLDGRYSAAGEVEARAIAKDIFNRMCGGDLDDQAFADAEPLLEPLSKLVEKWFRVYNENFSPSALATILPTVSLDLLECAHQDLAFLMGSMRSICWRALLPADETEDPDLGVVEMMRSLGWTLGKKFLLLDLALRLHGNAEAVEESMAAVRRMCDAEGAREGVTRLLDVLEEGSAVREDGRIDESVMADPDVEALRDALGRCWNDLVGIWSERVRDALPELQDLVEAPSSAATMGET